VTDAPIGIFDSGVGGLTVARAVMEQLPYESVIYVGDTANGPYGPQSLNDVRSHALTVMDRLVDQGVKMLVIACNTASSAALRDARDRYESRGISVVEVIQPAVRRAVRATANNRVGVIATSATVDSGAYEDAFTAAIDIELTTTACPKLVEFIEEGIIAGDQVLDVLKDYLRPAQEADVDTLVLGCTHYPLLTSVISFIMGPDVALVSSAEETAKDVYRALRSSRSLRRETAGPPMYRFVSTGDPQKFQTLAHRFLGPEVGEVESV